MNTVRSRIKTPANRTIKLKIPEFVPVNEPVDVIMVFNNDSYQNKIKMLENIKNDEAFLEDIKHIEDDFKVIDNKPWD